MSINKGAGGFHLYTVVTDGYGNYIAEDTNGEAIAKVPATGETNADFTKDMNTLAGFVATETSPRTWDNRDSRSAVDKVTDALSAAGLHPQDIGGGILNLYTKPTQTHDGYVGTVTVTVTP